MGCHFNMQALIYMLNSETTKLDFISLELYTLFLLIAFALMFAFRSASEVLCDRYFV